MTMDAEEKVRAVLERVAIDLGERKYAEDSNEILAHLERNLLPLLLAGQAMSETIRRTHALPQVAADCNHEDCRCRRAWDAALAAAEKGSA